MAELVTVRRYRDLSEAIVARSLLESCGMEVYLFDENLVRLDWQLSNFVGGIRLQVELGSEVEAKEILDSPVPEQIDYGITTLQEFAQPRCPRCGSVELTFEGASRAAALASLYVAALPWPTGKQRWSCAQCGLSWEPAAAAG